MIPQRLRLYLILGTSSVLGIAAGWAVSNSATPAQTLPTVTESTPYQLAQATPSPTPTPAPPHELSIPALGITAPVEHVGLEPDGRMASPANPDNVAWYELGSRPGTLGNAVIAGHLDSETGPAVFYKVDTLMPGDRITVTDADDRQHTYTVQSKQTYATAEFPMDEVFGPTSVPHLNLITCGGLFDNQTKEYSHRTVIYATLDSSDA